MTGGHEFTTGGYKYHIFDTTGPLVVSSPGASAVNAAIMVVGGGGGGGSYPGSDRVVAAAVVVVLFITMIYQDLHLDHIP